jgi:flagellar basal-body rod protein FlgB
VANAETPAWRRQDLAVADFQRELSRAVDRRSRTPGRFEMRPVSLAPEVARGPFVLRRNEAGMLRHDGNNVDVDREMALLGRNALYHNTMAALLRSKYQGMVAAIEARGTSA